MSEQQTAKDQASKPLMTVVPPAGAEAQPVAVALPVKDIASLSGNITADASASTGGKLAYFWQCITAPQGAKPDIVSPYTARTLITRLSPGKYVFQVVVSNSQGFHMSKISFDVFAPVPDMAPSLQPEQAAVIEEQKQGTAPEPPAAEAVQPAVAAEPQAEPIAEVPALPPPPPPTRHAPETVPLSSPTIPALSAPVSPYRSIDHEIEQSPVISIPQQVPAEEKSNRSIYLWAGASLAAVGLATLIYKAFKMRQGGGIK